jgi:hypothetical protein
MPQIQPGQHDPQQTSGMIYRPPVTETKPPKPPVVENPIRYPKVTPYRQDIREMRPSPKRK